MQYLKIRKAIGLFLALAFYIGGSHTALAVGTAAGTDIGNTATVDYQVGGVSQPQVTSNQVIFRVDNRVDLSVSENATTYVDVVPGADPTTGAVLSFTVTNTGNQTQDYSLVASNGSDPFGGTDNFNASTVNVFVEDGTTAGYQAAEDTATYIDELAPDATTTVYIVADIPVSQSDGDIAAYTLTAETRVGGTPGSQGALTDDTVANTTTGEEVVHADLTGDTDADYDGAFSDTGAFRVQTASLTVTKSISSVVDEFGNGYAIPGATVTYQLLVENTGSSDATSVVIVDAPPANTTYAAGSIVLAGTGSLTDASDGDAGDWDVTNAGAVTVTIPTIAAGATATITFDVTVD